MKLSCPQVQPDVLGQTNQLFQSDSQCLVQIPFCIKKKPYRVLKYCFQHTMGLYKIRIIITFLLLQRNQCFTTREVLLHFSQRD